MTDTPPALLIRRARNAENSVDYFRRKNAQLELKLHAAENTVAVLTRALSDLDTWRADVRKFMDTRPNTKTKDSHND
ncbi:hypothetical protein QCD70_05510 [Agreia sp. PsM10]|uniref:hypothetical protein n=1 Tax=Agreia sp. PsM10 TaxID=3030533 RepID=UPI00263BADB8|nr:hypothetical protein [Agreia sp. PsM10]MDN4639697.1 hypothetical protein [Agreia sp. PsM10]